MFIHNFSPVLIDLGYFEIRWYSIAYIFGIIFCWLYSRKIVKKFQTNHPFFSIKEKDFDDLVGYLIIGIIVGGRIGYVLFYNYNIFLQDKKFRYFQIFRCFGLCCTYRNFFGQTCKFYKWRIIRKNYNHALVCCFS